MSQKLIDRFLAALGVLGLIMVRVLEEHLFYDPFLQFFKIPEQLAEYPQVDWVPLTLSILFRYVLNAFFSMWIVYFLFKNKLWVRHTGAILAIVFILVAPLYFWMVWDEFSAGRLFGFYVRRFMIQPVLLLVIIPFYFYQNWIHQQKNQFEP